MLFLLTPFKIVKIDKLLNISILPKIFRIDGIVEIAKIVKIDKLRNISKMPKIVIIDRNVKIAKIVKIGKLLELPKLPKLTKLIKYRVWKPFLE